MACLFALRAELRSGAAAGNRGCSLFGGLFFLPPETQETFPAEKTGAIRALAKMIVRAPGLGTSKKALRKLAEH